MLRIVIYFDQLIKNKALLTANVKAPVQPVANVSPLNVGQFRGVLNQPQQLVLVNQPFQAAGSGPLFAIPAASLHQMIKSGTFKLQPVSNQVAVTPPASTPPASTPKQELAATPAAVPNKDASEDAEAKRTVAKSKVDKGKPMEKRKRSSSKDGSAQYKVRSSVSCLRLVLYIMSVCLDSEKIGG